MAAAINDTEQYLSLVTFRRNGAAVATPVWFVCNPEDTSKIYVFTDGTSGKVKRLRASDRVRFAPCSVTGAVAAGVKWTEARCRILDDAEQIKKGYAALDRKYTWKLRSLNLLSTLGGRIGRRAMLEIWIDTNERK